MPKPKKEISVNENQRAEANSSPKTSTRSRNRGEEKECKEEEGEGGESWDKQPSDKPSKRPRFRSDLDASKTSLQKKICGFTLHEDVVLVCCLMLCHVCLMLWAPLMSHVRVSPVA